MTKAEAAAISEAIHDIEGGRIAMGVRLLRTLVAMGGHKPPPERVIAARQPHPPEREKKQ